MGRFGQAAIALMNKVLSAQQVAGSLGMHIKTLQKLLRENKIALNFIQIGRKVHFRPADVEKYLDSLRSFKTDRVDEKQGDHRDCSTN
jgi:excisionase family DNA binding protein